MKILIADDDILVRDGMRVLLDLEDDFTVTATAGNGLEAYELCKEYKPDIVLMDIRMPGTDGVIGTKLIKDDFPEIKVIILTTFNDDEYIRGAIQNGAEGYILKNMPDEDICEMLRAVYKGSFVFQREVIGSITTMFGTKKKIDLIEFGLSPRESEIVKLISKGFSNREIGGQMYIGEQTVRNYVTVILEKLQLRDRTQLAIYYLEKCEGNH